MPGQRFLANVLSVLVGAPDARLHQIVENVALDLGTDAVSALAIVKLE